MKEARRKEPGVHPMKQPVVAAAILAVVCLSLVALSFSAVADSQVAPPPRATLSPLQAYGEKVGATDLSKTIQLAHLEGFTPAKLNQTLEGVMEIYPTYVGPRLASEAGDILLGCAATGITGALIGGIFGGVAGAIGGAIAGCAIGALTAYQAYEDGLSAAQLALANTAKEFATGEQASINNEVNITGQLLATLASSLNLTQYGMDAWAESAALSQLGNDTFSPQLDLMQTEIPYDLAVPFTLVGNDYAAIANATAQWWLAKYGANGQFDACDLDGNGAQSYLTAMNTIACPSGYEQSTPVSVFDGGASVAQGEAFIAFHGGNLLISGTSGQSLTQEVGGSYQYTLSGSNEYWSGFPGPTGIYTFPGEVTGLVAPVQVPGGVTKTVCYTIGAAESGTPDTTNANTGDVGILPCGGKTPVYALYDYVSGVGAVYNQYYSTPSPVLDSYPNQTSEMETNAVNSAQFYWQFLRSLGYTSASQIPAQCQIPEPYMALPPSVNLGNLTVSDYEALYYSWTQAVGNYYGVNASTISSTCTNGHNPGGGGSWWVTNLTVNSTLSVYIANSTEYPSENLSNLSSWAYQRVQAIWWPEQGQVTFPAAQVSAIPSNDPIQVVIPSKSAFLTLTGNGPKVQGAVDRLGATGDYIFIWSCTINGVPTQNCTVGSDNVSKIFTNITCGGGSSQCGLQSPSFIFSLPNWLGGIENFFSSLLGGGPLGALLGSLLTDLVIIAAVVLAIYAVYRVVTYRGKRGGGGTYIVTGSGR